MTSVTVDIRFSVISVLTGTLEDENFNLLSCEHWSDKPFEEKFYKGPPEGYNYKWLILFEIKEIGYYMIEREVVFNLKNGDFAFCSTKKHIGKLLGKENSDLG